MKAKELINALRHMDKNTEVVITLFHNDGSCIFSIEEISDFERDIIEIIPSTRRTTNSLQDFGDSLDFSDVV